MNKDMRNELITKGAAFDALCKAGCDSGYCGVSCNDVKAIENLPPAKPQRSRGRWESYLTDGLKYKCSECGSRFTIPWHFCPNCGSDNRGEDDET